MTSALGWIDELSRLGLGSAASTETGLEVALDRGEVAVRVSRSGLRELALALRDRFGFELAVGVTGVHHPDHSGAELVAIYQLVSVSHVRRLRLEVTAPDADPHLPSLAGVWPSLDWHEREIWDMFGLIFDDHPAMTRILMPDDWQGHPQRKDYPLGGIPVQYKGATIEPPDQRLHAGGGR